MNQIFPGPLHQEDLFAISDMPLAVPEGAWFVSSGHHAIRLLLRQLGLTPGSRVALPALICPSVVSAICAEGMVPDFVDIEPDLQVMAFNRDAFACRGFNLILLPHLYGMAHPQTQAIRDFAGNAGIPLIHDVAQSYGLTHDGVPMVMLDQGGLYSFGAGKASTAATGALVYGLKDAFAIQAKLHRFRLWDFVACHFLKQRMGIPCQAPWLKLHYHGFRASRIQVRAANLVMSRFVEIEQKRHDNWDNLAQYLGDDFIGAGETRCSYYKFVLKTLSPDWSPPLELAAVPWRRVVRHPAQGDLPNYRSLPENLIELSTEYSPEQFRDRAG
ncbi:MAG: DegT/DnrJ/EryC1/StrS aminotransferase family protein [Magnetococcales bacterium]|nr:DegT/DnrJ/EryC1/StrS aminotransferase family protein [Magnetococcales bacterium]